MRKLSIIGLPLSAFLSIFIPPFAIITILSTLSILKIIGTTGFLFTDICFIVGIGTLSVLPGCIWYMMCQDEVLYWRN